MIPRAYRRARRGLPACLAAVLLVLAPVPKGAPAGDWESLTLVWSLQGGPCRAVPMAMISDHVWAGNAAVPHPEQTLPGEELLQFLFMIDGDMQPAHYGHGGPGPFDLAFAADPPNLAAPVSAYGTWLFELDEARQTCSATPAPGSALLSVVFVHTPEPVPLEIMAGTRASLLDETWESFLGTFPLSVDLRKIALTGLMPGHNYLACVAAPGYRTETVTFLMPDMGFCDILVTMSKLVPRIATTWGDIKALYH